MTPEERKARKREQKRRWDAQNRDRERERKRRWYEANRDRLREVNRRWYEQNPDRARSAQRRRYDENRRRVDAIKLEAGCADCGYREHPAALDFDHLGDKRANIAAMMLLPWPRIAAEIAKCEVVCANHHRIRTFERLRAQESQPDSPLDSVR